jgi:hypothetical protein
MLIYAEDGALRADYLGFGHVIHYTSVVVEPGLSATFLSQGAKGAPVFRLRYRLTAPRCLTVSFEVEAPGASAFTEIASGAQRKSP